VAVIEIGIEISTASPIAALASTAGLRGDRGPHQCSVDFDFDFDTDTDTDTGFDLDTLDLPSGVTGLRLRRSD